MVYRLYLNEQVDAKGRNIGWFGYEPGHTMELAYTGIVPTDADETKTLERIWCIFNIQHPVDYRRRSMCVGDVIVLIDGPNYAAYKCDPVGFSLCDFDVPADHRPMVIRLTALQEEL